MKWKDSLYYLFAFLLWFAAAGAAVTSAETGLPADPHDFRAYGIACSDCHVSRTNVPGGNLARSTAEICGRCHTTLCCDHPVGVDSALNIPAAFPLDRKGLLTCVTCHDPHANAIEPANGNRTHFLRGKRRAESFCKECHGVKPRRII